MNNPIKVLFLTKYARNGASSRYRILQYLPYFEQVGIECDVSPLFDENYLENRYRLGRGSIADIARCLLRRFRTVLTVQRFDIVLIQKELVPYFPPLAEQLLGLLGVPYVVDCDDAVFHQYDQHNRRWIRNLFGQKIARVMRGARLVTVGNSYLSNYACSSGAPWVEIIPTVVDLDRYPPRTTTGPAKENFTIGWIGSPSTADYLEAIAPALAKVCANAKGRVFLIGSGPVDLPGVPVDVLPWSEDSEVDLLTRCDIGIMPLPDSPWERGKCGLKLIQYMACGLPVVASPVGENCNIVRSGENGFLAATKAEWADALTLLVSDPALRLRMGRMGRIRVEAQYSLQVQGPRLAGLLKSMVKQDIRSQ